MRAAARAVAALSVWLATGCGEAPDLAAETHQEAISGGAISGPEDDFVVRLVGAQPRPYTAMTCSGTLVAPNLVVTALHCLAVFDAFAAFGCLPDGSLVPSSRGGWIGETLEPAGVEVYFGTATPPAVAARGTHILGSGSTTPCVDDVAFLVLDTALPARGVPIRVELPVTAGEPMTVIGHGLNDWDDVPRARRSGITVLDVGPDDVAAGTGTAAPRTFIVGDGPCSGDNGAPALSDETGALTGVFAFNFSGDCTQPGTRGWFTKLSPFRTLLELAFETAGRTPLLEGRAPPAETTPRAEPSCRLGARAGQSGLLVPAFAVLLLLGRRARASSRLGRGIGDG